MPPVPDDLTTFLASTPLFQRIPTRFLQEIAGDLELLPLASGHVLIPQGSSDDALYLVISGTLTVSAAGPDGSTFLTALGPGESVGGWPLLVKHEGFVEVIAIEEALVARLARRVFENLLVRCPEMFGALTTELHRSLLMLALHRSQLFGGLDELARRDLESELELRTFSGGDVLFRQGDHGDYLFVVVSGRLRVVVRHTEEKDRPVSELGIGEIVGEMSVISGEPRSATVYAVRDTQVAMLTKAGFERFMLKHPQAALHTFTRKVVLRLREQLSVSSRREKTISTVAVVPCSQGVPISEFAGRLRDALSGFGSTLHLNSRRLDESLSRSGAAQAPEASSLDLTIVEWLSRCESDYRYVVYECDAAATSWTRRCLRQADHVLLVANAGSDPAPGEIETCLMSSYDPDRNPTRSLVLLHRNGAHPPSGTEDWLARRQVERHYHVRWDAQADFERVARFLLGRAFGLTLGGGFARGLVHVGVIRALAAMGIAIDAIGGNSMGALIGALWALGWDGSTILQKTAEGCAACISGMTIPYVAFKSGGRFSSLIQEFTGAVRIEDLWVPYFCVSANLNRAELHVHTRGSLAKAILASSRVPGVFPPVVYDGEMHVDGGVLNNVPVDVMRTFTREGLVMGVDAVPSRQFGAIRDYGFDLAGWKALWTRFSPFHNSPERVPNILQIMLRTIEFGGVSSKRLLSQAADLYLQPPLQKFKPTDFECHREVEEIGYRCALQALEGWLNSGELPPDRKPFLTWSTREEKDAH